MMSSSSSISSLSLLLLLVVAAARALSQDEYSKPISWSFELPGSTTVSPFSRPLDTAPDSSITRAEPLKQSISDNVGHFVNSNEIHLDAAGQQHPSQPAAPYLKPWPPIKWPLRPPTNEQRVTFSDGLNTTMPWTTNSSSDWSSRITPLAMDAATENYQYIGQQVGGGQLDQVAIAPTDMNYSNHLTSASQSNGNAINAHALNYLSLLTKPTHHLQDPSNSMDWTRFASNELAQRSALPSVQFLRLPDHLKQPGWQKTQFKKQTGPLAKSAWFKPFAPKRRSYETISELNQYSPRTAATSVYFDDSLEAINRPKELMEHVNGDAQIKTNKDYLPASYASLPVIYETGAPMAIERKNSKLEAQDDQLSSLIDSFASGSKYSVSASMPNFYGHAGYPAIHHMPAHTTHRKGLEKSLGVSILVGIGAALISFLIISNLFLSVPLFAMTLMQLLNGNPMLMPNNNNGNNQVPNNNNNNPTPNNNNPSTNGRKRRHIQDIELEERIQKVLSDSGRY